MRCIPCEGTLTLAEAEYLGWFDMISSPERTENSVGDDGTAAPQARPGSRAGSDADPRSQEDWSSDQAGNDSPGCSTGARFSSVNTNRSADAMSPSTSKHLVDKSEGAALPPAFSIDSRTAGGLGDLNASGAVTQASTASDIQTSFGTLTSEASTSPSPKQLGSGNDSLGKARSDEGSRCWGGMLAGDSSRCEPLEPTTQKCIHFKERICSRCTASGILVPRAMIRVLEVQHNSVFTNRPTQGLWTQTHTSLPGFRVVNQTQGCTGPPLVIFETAPEAEALARLSLRHVESGDVVHLHLCRGTFVPRSSAKRMRSGMGPVARALPQMGPPPKKMLLPSAVDHFGASGAMQGAGFQGAGFQGAGFQGTGFLGSLPERSGLEMASHPALLPSMCTLQTLGTTLAAGQPWLGSARHSTPTSDAVDLRGRTGDLLQPGVPTSKAFENGPALGLSGQAGAAPFGAPHAQLMQPLFVQRYVSLHIELSSLVTNHLLTHESLEPVQRVELSEQLKRSLAVVQHSNLGLLRMWR